MPGPIDTMYAAGFSDEEISTWAVDRRAVMQVAGFDDNEIDGYFAGGVTAPKKIPPAFENRLAEGELARKREGGLMQTIPQGVEAMSTPEGRARMWDTVKSYPSHFIQGMIDTIKLPGDVAAGKIDLSTEEGIDQAIGLGTLVGFGRLGKLPLTGKTSGLSVASGGEVARIERAPTGEIHELPIGSLPRSEDFVNAATVTGDSSMAVQQKLLRLYEELGRHPSEVAHDAAADPVIAQRLLSKDPKDMPYGAPPAADSYIITDPLGAKAEGETLHVRILRDKDGRIEALDSGTGITKVAPAYRDLSPEEAIAHTLGDHPMGTAPDVSKVRKAVEGEGGKPPEPPEPPPPKPPEPPPPGSFEEAQGKILAKIDIGGKDPERKLTFDRLYTEAIDDLHPIRLLDKDAYELARLTRGQFGKAEFFLEQSTFDFGTLANTGKPLREILAPVRDDLTGLRAYLASKRAIEIEASGRKSGMDLEAATKVAAEGEGKYGKIAGELVGYQNRVLAYLRDSGVLSAEAFDAMMEAGRNYVPFYRLIAGEARGPTTGSSFGPGNPVKRLKGSERDIIDPIESIIKNTYAYISVAERNAVGIEIIDALKKEGFEAKVDKPPAPKHEAPIVQFRKDAAEIERTLPPVADGSVRLWRGNRPGEVGANPVFTNDLPGIALPFRKSYGGPLSYVDVPAADLAKYEQHVGVAKGAEFLLPKEVAAKAKVADHNVKTAVGPDAELLNYLKEQGVTSPDKLVDFVKEALPERADTLSAFRDGVRETVKVNDPDLVAAFHGLDREGAGLLVRILAVPAKTLRAGAVLTPEFMARNLIRDFLTAFINTKGGIFTPIDTAKGLMGVIRRDADYQNWVKGGGANSTFVALDRRYMQESITKLSADTGLMTRAWNVITSPLQGLRMLSELFENATRVGEFKKMMRGMEGKEAIQAAAFSSREVTLDFARMGAKMRGYNMLTAFANAQIQGVDRTVRAFKDRPINTTLKVAGGITLPSIYLWWANHDDPRYQELPAWQRDLFWIILTDDWQPISAIDATAKPAHLVRQRGEKWEFNNGIIGRVPKPFELGVIFGSGVERALDQLVGNNPEAFKSFSKSMVEAVLPSYIPTVGVPLLEQFANRSTFTGRTIIPADVEKHLPEYQFTPYTTELSKKLGQVISAFPGVRETAVSPDAVAGPAARALTTPALIENYVCAWTGGLGSYAITTADAALRKAGALPDPIKPVSTLADIPLIKAFAVRYPSASTQSIQDFYDDYARNKRFETTWMAKAKEGDAEAMNRIAAAGGPRMFLQLDGIKEALTDHSKLVRDVYKHPTMPAEEKRQLIDGLYYSMIQLGRGGRDIMREMKTAVENPAE